LRVISECDMLTYDRYTLE